MSSHQPGMCMRPSFQLSPFHCEQHHSDYARATAHAGRPCRLPDDHKGDVLDLICACSNEPAAQPFLPELISALAASGGVAASVASHAQFEPWRIADSSLQLSAPDRHGQQWREAAGSSWTLDVVSWPLIQPRGADCVLSDNTACHRPQRRHSCLNGQNIR